jgi:hypothetical protein
MTRLATPLTPKSVVAAASGADLGVLSSRP